MHLTNVQCSDEIRARAIQNEFEVVLTQTQSSKNSLYVFAAHASLLSIVLIDFSALCIVVIDSVCLFLSHVLKAAKIAENFNQKRTVFLHIL